MSCIVFLRKMNSKLDGLKYVVLRFLFLVKDKAECGAHI